MSSIPKINGIGKVKFAKFQSNESTTSPRVYLNDYGYDSFTPSFKGGAGNAVKKAAAPALASLIAASAALTNTGCSKENLWGGGTNITITESDTISQTVHIVYNNDSNPEIIKLLQQLVELMQQNNAQNAAFYASILTQLADQGADIHDILDNVHGIYGSLGDLVQSNQEIKEILERIDATVALLPNMLEGQNNILSQILAVALNLNASNNANQEAIIALLNQLLDQVVGMNQQQASNFAAILQELNHLGQTQQAQLLAILEAIQNLDANTQAGYQSLLAQLYQLGQSNAQLHADLLNLISHIGELGNDIQAMFNQFMAQFNQFSQQIQAKLAAVLAQLQNMQTAQQQQYLNILNQLVNMQEAQQEQYLNILANLPGVGADYQQMLLDILTQLQNMQNAQEQQYLNYMQQLQGMQQAQQQQFIQILAQMVNMQEAQQQQYLGLIGQLQNMQAAQQQQFLAFMAKLTNLENGQQAILDAIQGLSAQYLAEFAQALAKLDAIEANQVTQIGQLAQIYAAIQAGNVQLDHIADLIENLDLGNIGADLDVIKSLLQQIRDLEEANGNVLQNMDANIALIRSVAQTLQQKMGQVVSNQEIMTDWLVNIFNKIPDALNNCNCSECCAQLIVILQQIDQHIQDLDWNHEGIDDELNNLLNPVNP